MSSQLLSPYTIKNVTLKNRVVMSPMAMQSANNQGEITDWHRTHYASRALGQVGLIMLETIAISPDGVASAADLGIWNNQQASTLKSLVELIQSFGTKVAAQIGHSGRMSKTPIAPSAIPFSDTSPVPLELSKNDIVKVINDFKVAAIRCKEAGFDILEIHAAHGFLIHTFLSPLSNQRSDEYGGNADHRYRFLGEIIEEIKSVWSNPLFVRISSTDFHPEGNTLELYIDYAKKMKAQGVDLIDCSSGGVVPVVKAKNYADCQISAAQRIKKQAQIATGAVGSIKTGSQAEDILKNDQADLIFIGRALLRNPFWVRSAAEELSKKIQIPEQYTRFGCDWLKS